MNAQMTQTPTYRRAWFIGGPMHCQWFEVPERSHDVAMRFSPILTFSPLGRDRYTRRYMTRIVGDDRIEFAELFAHELWDDEDIRADMIPDEAWRDITDEERI